mmetsp:Transcript_13011/g.20866  ORF Transcript_13011/g.20866 Transcript_13011/m.20866 type:complete len:321 (-) Transcript_13011:195-1157(-)
MLSLAALVLFLGSGGFETVSALSNHRADEKQITLEHMDFNFTHEVAGAETRTLPIKKAAQLIEQNEATSAHPANKKGSYEDGEDTPAYAFAVQSFGVAIFFTGLVLHFYDQWSPAVICFAVSFFLDILVTHTAAWTGHNADFAYECYRTFSLLAFRTVLIFLVILKVDKLTSIFLGVWNFLDISATVLMFMACDYINKVSYESGHSQALAPLKWAYNNPEARFALEYGTMFFLLCTYELTWTAGAAGGNKSGAFNYSNIGRGGGGEGGGSIYSKLQGVLLTVAIISSILFIWDGLNSALLLVQGIGFFTGSWKDQVCNKL